MDEGSIACAYYWKGKLDCEVFHMKSDRVFILRGIIRNASNCNNFYVVYEQTDTSDFSKWNLYII